MKKIWIIAIIFIFAAIALKVNYSDQSYHILVLMFGLALCLGILMVDFAELDKTFWNYFGTVMFFLFVFRGIMWVLKYFDIYTVT